MAFHNEDFDSIAVKYNDLFTKGLGRDVLKDLIETFDNKLSPPEDINKFLYKAGQRSVIEYIINYINKENKYNI